MKFSISGLALAAAFAATMPAIAWSAPSSGCAHDAFSVVMVDDQIHTAAWRAEALRTYRLPNFATVARTVAEKFCELTVLDADPYFAPGRAPEPRLLLRGRITDVKAADRSLADKADTAVRRYIESYIGAPEMQQAIVDAMEVSVDVVCVAQRRALRTLVATGRRKAEAVSSDNAPVYAAAVEQLLAALVKDAHWLASNCPARASWSGAPDTLK